MYILRLIDVHIDFFMENVALNLLPILQSNTVTVGLLANTGTEVVHRLAAGKPDLAAIAEDVALATVFGAATLLLPEIGIHTSPELAFYAAMIGFNLPTILKVKNGQEEFWQSSLAMGTGLAAAGAVTDVLQYAYGIHSIEGISLNANQFVKNGVQFFSSLKTK